MQVSYASNNFNAYNASYGNYNSTYQQNLDKFKEAISNANAKDISNSNFINFQTQAFSQSSANFSSQFGLEFLNSGDRSQSNLSDIFSGIDYAAIGYQGRPLDTLSQTEASELVSENGFFGITNTSDRISNFVISGAGDDLSRLQAGREGVMRGFEEVKRLWGDELPEISQKTMERTLLNIDRQIAKLGGNVLNVSA